MAEKDKNNIITVADMAPHVHKFLPTENKVDKLVDWLSNWIKLSLECGKIKPYDFLPTKVDLAFHIGVSQGTMQNVFRRVEDLGLIESKQKIGSYIKPQNSNIQNEKLTSKREFTVELLKRYILDNQYQLGDKFESSRNLAKYLGVSNSTIIVAIKKLVSMNILTKNSKAFYINKLDFSVSKIKTKTLAEKIADNIKAYIDENLKENDKLPTNTKLMKMYNVSIKTIHDAIKILSREGYVYTRRGQYGTIVLGEKTVISDYDYEIFEHKIKNYISTNHQVGDKLPPIKDLANHYKTSEKTIKKALDNLAEDGFITFVRGRYGGTFITDIPQTSSEAYKWLAISNDYMAN